MPVEQAHGHSGMSRATINDIAKHAGVSAATVDRVLNNRPGVHPRTQALVLTTAQSLKYVDRPADASGPVFDIILPGANSGFNIGLAGALQRNAAILADNIQVRTHLLKNIDAALEVECLESVRESTQGIGILAVDQLQVREALLSYINAGVPVVTIANDISSLPHQGYMGADERRGGRLAGYIMGRFVGRRPARIAVFTGALAFRGHEAREMGFRHIISEEYPSLEIFNTGEVVEDDAAAYDMVRQVVKDHGAVDGFYSIGYGTIGIARALEDLGIADEAVFIAHELYEESRGHLINGTLDAVIDQNIHGLAKSIVGRLYAAWRKDPLPAVMPRDLRIIFKENIPLEILPR